MDCLTLELLDTITEMVEVDRVKLECKVIDIFTRYEIKQVRDVESTDVLDKIESFIAAKKIDGLSPKTLKGYKLNLNKFAKYIRKNITETTTNDIRLYLSTYDHHKISTISTITSILKSFFKWLYDEELIERNVTSKIKNPKKEKRLPKALSIDELETVRETCISKRERALIEVFYATGARLSELVEMNRTEIDYASRSIKVVGKGNKERTVYFSFKAMHHINNYLNERTDDCEALFITERKPYRRVGNRAVQCAIKKIADRSNIKSHLHPHALRHTLATAMLNNGAPIAAVQSILGHTDPATTQIYAQITEKTKQDNYLKYHVQ